MSGNTGQRGHDAASGRSLMFIGLSFSFCYYIRQSLVEVIIALLRSQYSNCRCIGCRQQTRVRRVNTTVECGVS